MIVVVVVDWSGRECRWPQMTGDNVRVVYSLCVWARGRDLRRGADKRELARVCLEGLR